MKRRWLLAALAAVVTMLVCLILFFFAPTRRRTESELVLWYAEDACSAGWMEQLCARCEKDTGLHVRAVAFADEDALAAAFEDNLPGLLWCSHLRAHDIGQGGVLAPLPEGVSAPVRSVEGFYPLGARLPVLLRDAARLLEAPSDLEALLTAGEEKLLAADSWADLLYESMFALGHPLSGRIAADRASRDYVRIYNLLARAAYDGAVVNARPAADCVRRGEAAAAVADSMLLAAEADTELRVDPLPLPAGAEPRYAGVWMGFALTRPDTETTLFLQWLSKTDRHTELALSLGLVPFGPGGGAGKTPLETALLAVARSAAVSALEPGCAYLKNRESFEDRLRLSLDLLA